MSIVSSVCTSSLLAESCSQPPQYIPPGVGTRPRKADMNDLEADLRGGKPATRVDEFWRCCGAPLRSLSSSCTGWESVRLPKMESAEQYTSAQGYWCGLITVLQL